MPHCNDEMNQLLALARIGNRDALGRLLEMLRPELREMARYRLEGKLLARLDESDLVQQACLSAFRNFELFTGDGSMTSLAG